MSTRHDLAQSEPRLQSGSPSSVDPKEMLRKSYSMPLSIRETSDIPNGSLTIKASESLPYSSIVRPSKSEEVVPQHQLDRYGFILNMDSQGNVVNDADQLNPRRLYQEDQSSVADDATDSLLNALHQTAPEPMSPQSPKLYLVEAERTPSEAARTARRITKWESMLRWPLEATTEHSDASNSDHSSWNAFWQRSQRQRRCRTVKRRLRKGIPNQQQRALVWPILCHVDERMRENPGLYRLLVETSVGGGSITPEAMTTNPSADPPPKVNGSSTTQNTSVMDDDSDKTTIEINYTKKIGPTQLSSSLKQNHRLENRKKHVIAFQYTKSFKNVQDTIERDLHRTFPRHSLFYTECCEDDSTENGHSNSWSRHDSLLNDDEQSSDTRELQQKSICGTTEISSLMRELDLVRSTTHSVDPLETQGPSATTNAPSTAHDTSSHGGETVIGLSKMLEGAGGQSRLRRVLNAYGTYDREIGYCQGMNFIAAMFLTLVTEEVAFWMLVSVMQDSPCRMRGMFGEGMRETHQSLYVAEKLIQQYLPKLYKHFEKETIHVTMFATQWLLTQYTSSFRFDLVTRLWDCFLFEGWKITYRVMLALLQHSQAKLLSMGFEEILAFFRELPDRPDTDGSIVDIAMKIPLKISHIRKYEKEWLLEQNRLQANPSR